MEIILGIVLTVISLIALAFLGLLFYTMVLEIKDRRLEIKEKERKLK